MTDPVKPATPAPAQPISAAKYPEVAVAVPVSSAHTAAPDKSTVSKTHVRDELAKTQLNGWSLSTQLTQTKASLLGQIEVVATKSGSATISSPITVVDGSINVIELWEQLALAVLAQCH